MASEQSFDINSAHKQLKSDMVEASSEQKTLQFDRKENEQIINSMDQEAESGRYSSQLLEMATMVADTDLKESPFKNERLTSAFNSQREFTREQESRFADFDAYGHQGNELNLVEYLAPRERQRLTSPELSRSPSEQDAGDTGAQPLLSVDAESTQEDDNASQSPVPRLDQGVTFTPVEEKPREEPDVDLTAVPAQVHDRFREGKGGKFFFKDGKDVDSVAFKDEQKRLVTNRDDTVVAHSLVDVAESRGWENIRVQGTKDFRREVWLEASARGIEVEGYKAQSRDKEDLEHRKQDLESRSNSLESSELAERDRQNSSNGKEIPDNRANNSRAQKSGAEGREAPSKNEERPTVDESTSSSHPDSKPVDRMEGKIVDHGQAPYKHDDRNKQSYFVELENSDGNRHTQWGVDLGRALEESEAGQGDIIKLEDQGQQPVKVKAPQFDKEGNFKGTKEIEAQRRTWSVHAQTIREQEPEKVAESTPELANEAAWMKAADLKIGKELSEPDREDFNRRVRERMADRVEQGQRAPDFEVTRPVEKEREPQQPEQARNPEPAQEVSEPSR